MKLEKKERMQLLHREREINFTHCEGCLKREEYIKQQEEKKDKKRKFSYYNSVHYCGGCEHYEELQSIGKRLTRQNKKKDEPKKPRKRLINVYPFKLEEYRSMREEHSMQYIAEYFNLSVDDLRRLARNLQNLDRYHKKAKQK